MKPILVLAILAACGTPKSKQAAPPGSGSSGAGDPFNTTGDEPEPDGEGNGQTRGIPDRCPAGSVWDANTNRCAKAKGGGGGATRGVVDVDGQAIVVGAIPKDSIHKVVRDNFKLLRFCYEQLLLRNPGLEGRVMVKMTVGIDGTVTDATATGVHPELESCVADKIRRFRFPRPDTNSAVEITYPFVFKAG